VSLVLGPPLTLIAEAMDLKVPVSRVGHKTERRESSFTLGPVWRVNARTQGGNMKRVFSWHSLGSDFSFPGLPRVNAREKSSFKVPGICFVQILSLLMRKGSMARTSRLFFYFLFVHSML